MYWLASRCIDVLSSTSCDFSMFCVSDNNVNFTSLYYSNDLNHAELGYAIRPVVEIDLTKVNVGLSGDGGVDTPYSIEAK